MAGRCQLRPASSADLAALAALEIASFTDPWTSAQLGEGLKWPGAVAIVATDGMALVGYVLARVIVDEAEILSLATIPTRRRQGIGTRLLEAGLEEFRRRDVHAVWLEVRESNEPAQALYRAYGFAIAGRRPEYYRHPVEDALVLRSELRPDALEGPPMR